jgi:hypothetical protein
LAQPASKSQKRDFSSRAEGTARRIGIKHPNVK